MDMGTEAVYTAVWQASKLIGSITRSTPRDSAIYWASITSKPTYCSCPVLEESTNSIGEKSGLRATDSTPSALIFSSALAGVFWGSSVLAGLLPQAARESARTSASSRAIIFFITVSSFLLFRSPVREPFVVCISPGDLLSLILHILSINIHYVKHFYEYLFLKSNIC